VSRIILLDGQFSRLPRVVAEGRQVIANVERLAKLFLTKTVYAILWAVTFGALLWPFPFLPRQLSIVDGLTIGIPALLLALLPNSRRYIPGFLRRAARFCIPAGLTIGVVIIGVVAYTFLSGYEASEVQSVAFVTLTLTALWVVVMLSRPFDRWKALVVLAMYAGLALVFAIPIATDFLKIELPPLELLWLALGASALGCLVLELLHRAQRNGHREAEAEVARAARITRRER
jgi:cation-transporting ATPase E